MPAIPLDRASTICSTSIARKALIDQNTRQFVAEPAGQQRAAHRVRAAPASRRWSRRALNAYSRKDGLRLIEVDKDDLHDLADIVDLIVGRGPERFIVFCDDLSFDEGERVTRR